MKTWMRSLIVASLVVGASYASRPPVAQQLVLHRDLVHPVPVVIFYATAIVDSTGSPRFVADIYGRDRTLEQELADPYYVGLRLGIESRCQALKIETVKADARLAKFAVRLIAVGSRDHPSGRRLLPLRGRAAQAGADRP